MVDESDPETDEDQLVPEDYNELLEGLAKKWQLTQLTHNVSVAAANSFWNLSLSLIPGVFNAKENSVPNNKQVPGFVHMRRKLYKDISPPIHMKFVYLNRSTNMVETIHCSSAPRQRFPKSQYIKLYEEAHIKVL